MRSASGRASVWVLLVLVLLLIFVGIASCLSDLENAFDYGQYGSAGGPELCQGWECEVPRFSGVWAGLSESERQQLCWQYRPDRLQTALSCGDEARNTLNRLVFGTLEVNYCALGNRLLGSQCGIRVESVDDVVSGMWLRTDSGCTTSGCPGCEVASVEYLPVPSATADRVLVTYSNGMTEVFPVPGNVLVLQSASWPPGSPASAFCPAWVTPRYLPRWGTG